VGFIVQNGQGFLENVHAWAMTLLSTPVAECRGAAASGSSEAGLGRTTTTDRKKESGDKLPHSK
jgi:hypothetical protein